MADYRAVDPRDGTMEDLEELIREADRRGIGLMLDMVFNHTSTAVSYTHLDVYKRQGLLPGADRLTAERRDLCKLCRHRAGDGASAEDADIHGSAPPYI